MIVQIDGGLHFSEIAGGQHSIALVYKFVSTQNDPEIGGILHNVVLVLSPTLNPDRHDLQPEHGSDGCVFEVAGGHGAMEAPWTQHVEARNLQGCNEREGRNHHGMRERGIEDDEQDHRDEIRRFGR